MDLPCGESVVAWAEDRLTSSIVRNSQDGTTSAIATHQFDIKIFR
jgi:hypothetical protein